RPRTLHPRPELRSWIPDSILSGARFDSAGDYATLRAACAATPNITIGNDMRNLLITGGAGFIGSNFVHYMLERYPEYRIVVYDKLTYAGRLANLDRVQGDPRFAF